MAEPGPSAPGEAGETIHLFPSAAQPNIIRAFEKDEVYLQYLTDSCHDAIRRLLGPRQALLWARETKLLAELLYFALTTGGGLQTLGEEYCDVLQVTGRVGVPPGPLQRGVLVLLQTMAPYLAERVVAPQDEGFAAWQASRWQQEQRPGLAGLGPGQGAASWRQVAPRLGAWGRQAREHVHRALQLDAPGWPATCARFLWDNAGMLLQLHLALFYLYGTYFQPAKRVAGVRYLFSGRAFEGRPSYHVLGLVLLAQLGVSGAMWAARRASGAPLLGLPWGTSVVQQPAKPRHVVLQEGDGSEAGAAGAAPPHLAPGEVEGEWAAWSPAARGAAQDSARKCPLCLSARDHPTATPCGHVFCWRCIAEWVSQKPECPLCRSDVAAPSLVCVYHADF